jgi:DNA-binding SARP family transcriptional activator
MQSAIEVFLKKEDSSVTAHYQKLCEMLERELGVSPGPETQELYLGQM